MKTTYDFSNQIVVVTGGGQGIGLEICKAFSQAKAQVVCLEVNSECESSLPNNVKFLKTDVSDAEQCKKCIEDIAKQYGEINILINNAAIQPLASYKALHESDDDVVECMMQINIMGYRHITKNVIPHMLNQGKGAIVNIASAQGHQTAREVDPYGVTKAANLAQTRQWAIEYARQGIRVNSISPGAIRTPMVLASLAEQGGELELANRHPLGRLGQPEEIANAALFLASDAASFITAADLPVDGGLTSFASFAAPYDPNTCALENAER